MFSGHCVAVSRVYARLNGAPRRGGGGDKLNRSVRTSASEGPDLNGTEIIPHPRHKTNGRVGASDKLLDRDKLPDPNYATRGTIDMHATFRESDVLVNVEDAGIPRCRALF
jgi:hypothetical protein